MDEKDVRRKRNNGGVRWHSGRGPAATAMLCPPGRSKPQITQQTTTNNSSAPDFASPS